MNVTVAIVGLALLILVHEAGHFFVARAVGMRPRRFYLGFPPALVRVRRAGIEYGIGAIPLGGYVKIPGMHRPAAGDVDVHFARALGDAPGLTGPVERLKRALAGGDFTAAAVEADQLERLLAGLAPLGGRYALDLQAEGHVVEDGAVRQEAEVLEDHPHLATPHFPERFG